MDRRYFLRLAEQGAPIRLQELDTERQRILRQFPDLHTTQPASRVQLSPRARKLISQRMKAYWAKRRANKSSDNSSQESS